MVSRLENDRSQSVGSEIVEAEFKYLFHVDDVSLSERRHNRDVGPGQSELLFLGDQTPDTAHRRLERILAAVIVVHVFFMTIETDRHCRHVPAQHVRNFLSDQDRIRQHLEIHRFAQ